MKLAQTRPVIYSEVQAINLDFIFYVWVSVHRKLIYIKEPT